MIRSLLLFLAAVLVPGTALGQHRMGSVSPNDIVATEYPRIAVASDGSFGLTFDAERQVGSGSRTEWHVGAVRGASDGTLGSPVFFEAEHHGVWLWSADLVEHGEAAFQPNGTMVVAMYQRGYVSIGVDEVSASQVTLGAVEANGEVIDLKSGLGVQKRISIAADQTESLRERHPRIAATSEGRIFVALEALAADSQMRLVGAKAYDASLDELNDLFIPHDDPNAEEGWHYVPDVAVSDGLGVVVWQECPIIDSDRNANDCDIFAQFFSDALVGGNVQVSTSALPSTWDWRPSVDMNAAGETVVVWIDERDGVHGEVYAQRFNATGQPIGDNFRVSDSQGRVKMRPEVGITDDGRFMVVWEDSSSVGYRARYRMYGPDGAPQHPPQLLNEDAGEVSHSPHADGNGTWLGRTWMERSGEEVFIRYETFEPGDAIAVAAEEGPHALSLEAYPNPFAASATLSYDLDAPGRTRIMLYDVLGREVARLVDAPQPSGSHRTTIRGASLPPGAYLVMLNHEGRRESTMLIRAR